MKLAAAPSHVDADEEISTLIATLHATGKRLEELTGGEVDAVADSEGGTFLLHRAQNRLRQRQAAKQAAILDALPAHIAMLAAQGVLLSVNEAWRQFAGGNEFHCPGHGTGLNYLEICDSAVGTGAADAHVVARGIREVLGGAGEFSFEYACHAPTERRWFLMRVTPMAANGPHGVVVMHLNITERKLAEDAMRNSGIRMAIAEGIAHFGSWEQDLANRNGGSSGQLLWSDEMCRIAGHEPGTVEVSNELFFGLVHPDDRESVRQAVATAIRERKDYSLIHRLIRPDGETRIIHETAQIFYDENSGQPLKVVGTAQDITEWKLAEEALRESEDRFRGTFEQAAIGIAHVSTDGRFLRVNDKLCAILGYDRAELLGMTFMELTLPEDQARAQEARRAMLVGTQSSFISEKVYLRKGGQVVWINLATTLERTPAGEPKYFISVFEDITLRKQMEHSLRRSQAQLRMAGRLSRMGPWSVELPASSVIWSEEVCFIHEMPSGTMPTVEEALDYFVPESREVVSHAFETCTRDGTPYDLELQIITRTGKLLWVRSICEAERDDTGAIWRVQGNFQDISDRKLASEALLKQQTELRVLFDLVPAMILFKDTQDGILRVNQRVAEAVGRPVQEIEGRASSEVFPEYAEQFYADDLEVIRSGVPKLGHVENVKDPEGRAVWVQTDKVPYRDEDGKLIGIVVMAQDITERKQAEQRIAEQAALIDETSDAISVCDLDHGITFWSKGAERLYGWTADEAKGCSLHDLLKVDPQQSAVADRAVRQNGEWSGEIQKTSMKGAVLTVNGRWTLMRDALGQPLSILTIDTDVTERKKIEKQSLRSQRMESIGTLAGGIAHDLNNVLAPILMGVDFLKMKYPDASAILDRFETSANRGAGMVRQLLTFAKGAEGERVSIQTTHLVMEIKELMLGTFPKNIEIKVTCAPGLPTVLGDASQLHQILLNLCVNARDAMPSGGTLTLDTRSLDVDAIFASAVLDARPGRYVVLRVRDTGTGITPAILERIFDPFFTTKGPDKGTGLGLSTVMGIVKGLGGFLKVHSTPGEGSSFAVHLPAETQEGDTGHRVEAEPSFLGNGETLLLVDDEIGVLEVGRLVLTAMNYKVLTATDGVDGLAKALEHRSELGAVITDMHMPHMDGIALARALHRVLPDLPVIIGSGRLDDSTAEDLKMLGVLHQLDKPYTQRMLAAMLAKVLTGAKAS